MKKVNTGKEFIFGGDYNPEQWKNHPEILQEDIRLMKLAGCNAMTIGIFSWTELEPQEGKYCFDFMDWVMDTLAENGIKAVLATPSGARPAWLSQKYPEVLRTTEMFLKKHHGERHNHCYTSPIYREKVRQIDAQLATRYKDHPALLMWHVSNEFNGECYCEQCKKAFVQWLKECYDGDLERLNYEWWNSFWSHTYTDWSQIEPPSPIGECSVHALELAWKRFVTHQTIDFYMEEVNTLRAITPDIPITTNWYWVNDLNYKEFAKYVDVVAWDEYPQWHSPKGDHRIANETAFIYNYCRSLKDGQPFMLMESTPSCVSYREANVLKRPEMTLTSGLQAIAHGSDSVQYFQWRKSRGSFEKFHGAVVDHCGHENTRTFQEVTRLGGLLKELAEIKSAETRAEAAVVYDRENLWALNSCLGFKTHNMQYEETCFEHHLRLYDKGINIDVISPKDRFDGYKLLVIPMLYMMTEDTAERIERFVKNGGTAVMTYISGYVNETDLCYLGGFPAGRLKEVFGIWNEEIESMFDGVTVPVKSADGKRYTAKDYCELLHTNGAEALAVYDGEFFCGMPCVTKNHYGDGVAYYIGFRDTGEFLDDFYGKLLAHIGIRPAFQGELPRGVAAASRCKDGIEYVFLQNFTKDAVTVAVNTDIYSVMAAKNFDKTALTLSPYETAVIKCSIE